MRKLFLAALCCAASSAGLQANETSFNPQVSLILDGRYSSYEKDPEEYELPGFELAGEASHLPEEGFSLGHAELVLSADVDDKFYGQATIAVGEHEGEAEVEVEEAFIETTALSNGFKVKGGRFFSGIGYQNQQHTHAWDFIDAPLVYKGMWGQNYRDDGVRVSWVAPTETFVEVGAEAMAGRFYPSGNASDNIGAKAVFVNVGGDINESSSWLVGVSHHQTKVEDREVTGHDHGHEDEHHDEEEHHDEDDHDDEDGDDHEEEHEEHSGPFTGDSRTTGISAVYKWAPNGNYKNRHLKLQGEYFLRNEKGSIAEENEVEAIDADQKGYYVQGVYQFKPQWRVGLRYDNVESDRSEMDDDSQRVSTTLEYLPSEFSRVRLQYNRDESYGDEADNQVFLQYTMSLGAHGAHSF